MPGRATIRCMNAVGGVKTPRGAFLSPLLTVLTFGLLVVSAAHGAIPQTPDPIIKEVDDPLELQHLGVRFIEANQPDNAILALRKALRLYSENAETRMWLGVAHTLRQEYEVAEAYFVKALELNPRLTEVHNWFGFHWYQRQDPDRAVEEFRKALTDPSFPPPSRFRVLLNLGRIQLEREQTEAGVATLGQAIQITVQSSDPAYGLARVLLAEGLIKLGRPLEAIGTLESVTEQRNFAAHAHLLLGLAYRDLVEETSARRHLEDVLRLAPGTDLSERAIEALRGINGSASRS